MKELTDEERAIYEWQIWVEGLGESGQVKLKASTALVTRVGGLGGPLAQSLAAAGIGKLLLAHAGNTKPSDLNRQVLQTHAQLGKPRVESCRQRLLDLNPRLEVEAIAENVNEENAARLVEGADVVFDCAPLFEERLLLNRECVRQGKPLVDAAMFDLEGQLTTIIPGQTPGLPLPGDSARVEARVSSHRSGLRDCCESRGPGGHQAARRLWRTPHRKASPLLRTHDGVPQDHASAQSQLPGVRINKRPLINRTVSIPAGAWIITC